MIINNLRQFVKQGSDHLFFVGATLFSSVSHFLFSVYVKTKIEPLEFGIFSTCLLLNTYLAYVQFGVLNSFNRDYPQLIGAKKAEEARNYRNTTFTFLFFVLLISFAIVCGIVLLISNEFGADNRYTFGFILSAAITIVSVLNQFGNSRVRVDGGFKFVSLVIFIEAFAVIIAVLLIPLLGYYALYVNQITAGVIGIGLLFHKGFRDLSFHIDQRILKSMVLTGLPLLVNNLIWTVVNSIDKFVILSRINTEALGVYSIAQMAFSYMVLVPNAMSQLFYVNMGKVYGASSDVNELSATAGRYTKILAVVMSLIVLCAFFFIDPLVNWIMPNYAGGIRSAQILMLGLAIYSPTMVNSNILTILKKNAALLRSSIYLCVFNLVFSFGFVIAFGAKIEYVALGTAVSYLLRTAILVIQLKKYVGVKPMSMIKASIIPVTSILIPSVLIYYYVKNIYVGFGVSLLIAALISILLFKDKVFGLIKGGK